MRPSDLWGVSPVDALRLVGRPVAYYPKIAEALGSVDAAIFLCQFLYWEGKQSDKDGWIYKTIEEIKKETGLSYYEQKRSRKILKELGILEEKLFGLPARLYFKFNWNRLNEILLNYNQIQQKSWVKLEEEKELKDNDFLAEKHQNSSVITKNVQTSFEESEKLVFNKVQNYNIDYNSIDYKGINKINNINQTQTNEFNSNMMNSNLNSILLFKLVKWRRYKHPLDNRTTTIRQMIADVVCKFRKHRYLTGEEEAISATIQIDLNDGKITYEDFAKAYKEWAQAGNLPSQELVKMIYQQKSKEIIDQIIKPLAEKLSIKNKARR